MGGLDICVNTQTPLVQFPPPEPGRGRPSRRPTDLARLRAGVDYRFSPGGVTRMVFPLVKRLREQGVLGQVHWVSLNPSGPGTLKAAGITLHNIAMGRGRMSRYGSAKEAIWGTVHGTADAAGTRDLFWTDDFTDYAYYNRRTAELLAQLDRASDFDLFYIHDFQQLPMGEMLGPVKPKIFRWHIPFDQERLPEEWKARLASYLASYDAVVVSTERYLRSLKAFGYAGRAVCMYPYIDPAEYSRPARARVRRIGSERGLAPEDRVILVVGRMDPTKGQDRVVRAFAPLAAGEPRLRLVLVGNGSFSGSKAGLGLSKADRWREELERLARELGLQGRVLFTGHVSQEELDAYYERAEFTVLPSVQEGFGLVVIESWLHGRPTIVTRQSGVAELIEDGRNGRLFDPEGEGELGERMAELLADEAMRGRLGRAGRRTARRCTLDAAAEAESELLREVAEA